LVRLWVTAASGWQAAHRNSGLPTVLRRVKALRSQRPTTVQKPSHRWTSPRSFRSLARSAPPGVAWYPIRVRIARSTAHGHGCPIVVFGWLSFERPSVLRMAPLPSFGSFQIFLLVEFVLLGQLKPSSGDFLSRCLLSWSVVFESAAETPHRRLLGSPNPTRYDMGSVTAEQHALAAVFI
jgi:hypothetical protein